MYHLDGGIVTYGKDEEVKGKLWDGKCYVFDNRISVPINRTEEDIVVSKCSLCGEPSERYINCRNDVCHIQFICCESCEETHLGFCSDECHDHATKHPEHDSRLKLQKKLELYEKYGQKHDMYEYAVKNLK